jgi:hypothetical protein
MLVFYGKKGKFYNGKPYVRKTHTHLSEFSELYGKPMEVERHCAILVGGSTLACKIIARSRGNFTR